MDNQSLANNATKPQSASAATKKAWVAPAITESDIELTATGGTPANPSDGPGSYS